MEPSTFARRFVARRRSGAATVPVPDALLGRLAAEDNAVTITSQSIETLLGMTNIENSSAFGTMHTTATTVLNPTHVRQCFDALTSGIPYACINRINSELTRSGLQFTTNVAELEPTSEMQTYVKTVLNPLQQDALRAICAIGVVPIAFRRVENSSRVVPYVPAPKTYTIAVGTIRGARFFMLHWLSGERGTTLVPQPPPGGSPNDQDVRIGISQTSSATQYGRPDPSVVILHGFNADPDADGRICSVAAAFISATAQRARFLHAAGVAEAINMNPPLLRTLEERNDERQREKLRGAGYVGDGVIDPIAEDQAQIVSNRYIRNNQQIDGYQKQQQFAAEKIAALSGLPPPTTGTPVITALPRSGPAACDARGNLMPWANEAALPERWKLAQYHLPSPRSDLVQLMAAFDEEIFYSFGIPSQVLNANARLSADAAVAEKTLDVAVQSWKESIGRVLTFAYDSTYMELDVAEAIKRALQRRRAQLDDTELDRVSLAVSEEELRAITDNITSVQISYRPKAVARPLDLERLYARGVIEWDQFAPLYAQNVGLDPLIVVKRDPFTTDARRVVGMPEYGQYLNIAQTRADAAAEKRAASKKAIAADEDDDIDDKSTTAKTNTTENDKTSDDDTIQPRTSSRLRERRRRDKPLPPEPTATSEATTRGQKRVRE